MPEGSRQVTKQEWYKLGGPKNPKCWRRQRNGKWEYFVRND